MIFIACQHIMAPPFSCFCQRVNTVNNMKKNRNVTIAIVDDEINIRRSIEVCLQSEGFSVCSFGNAFEALKGIRESSFDLVIMDIRLEEENGIDLYRKLKEEGLAPPTVFISGNSTLNEAANSVKAGAFDFIEKPFSPEKLLITVNNCIEFHKLKESLARYYREQPQEKLLGEHRTIETLKKEISRVAKTNATVFISGESGTGKELVAESLHAQGERSEERFTKVNCSAIPAALVESTLFGHVKGAFTGATSMKKGFFEVSDGGTIFLDEIGDMPLSSQASLLRVLESQEIQKVGSDKISKVDVRVIVASHKDLKQEALEGRFREDLYYRISIIPLTIPSLRERSSDIPLLVTQFISDICERNGIKEKTIDPQCFPIMSVYPWPGNVRELRNTLERMVILGGDVLSVRDLPIEIRSPKADQANENHLTLKEYRQKAEAQFILTRIDEFSGNISKVAKSLGMDRTHLYKKMAAYGIERKNTFDT